MEIGRPVSGDRRGGTQLWKTADMMADKTGPRHTVYWVRNNKKFTKSKKLGLKTSESKYSGGSRYMGDWANNTKHGFGTLTKPNGQKYEGEWVHGKRCGKGTLLVTVGGKLRKRYTGDWVDNKRHGLGIYYYPNGAKFEGEWRSNLKHGHGKMVYANGDVYEGDWVDDKRSGLGVLTLANGDTYEGHWLNDKKEGPGRYFYVATRKMYEGEWVDDVAKCGVFSAIPMEAAAEAPAHPEDNIFALPSLSLKNPEAVVVDAVEEVRFWRASQIAGADLSRASMTAEDLTPDELAQLADAFDVADPDGTGLITGLDLRVALGQLGIVPTEEDMEALLLDLNAEPDSLISLDQFVACMARLKE